MVHLSDKVENMGLLSLVSYMYMYVYVIHRVIQAVRKHLNESICIFMYVYVHVYVMSQTERLPTVGLIEIPPYVKD